MGRGMRLSKIPYEPGDTIQAPHTAYRVVRGLGAGGMGFVVEAVDKNLGARVVLKMLHPELARSKPSLRERFRKEAMACAKLAHPSIVRVLVSSNLNDEAHTPFYAMEYLDGDSVREALDRRGAFRIDVAINIAANVLQGLHYMHKRGIVHRDVKPDNIIVHQDEHTREVLAKLIDLGVMRVLDDDSLEGFCGTPAYAAPEQIREASFGPPIDVFAAGCVLFEMLTGQRPYATYGVGERGALSRLDVVAPRLSEMGPSFPPALDDIVAQALSLDPAARPTAFDFADKLEVIVRALNKTFGRGIVTKDTFGRGDRKEETSQAITLADLEAPTDPWGPVPPWMQALREDAEIARALGRTAPDEKLLMVARTHDDGASPLAVANPGSSGAPATPKMAERAAEQAMRAAPTRESPLAPPAQQRPVGKNGTEPMGTLTPSMRAAIAAGPAQFEPPPATAPMPKTTPTKTTPTPPSPAPSPVVSPVPHRVTAPLAPPTAAERELASRLASSVREASPSPPQTKGRTPSSSASRRRAPARRLQEKLLAAALGMFLTTLIAVGAAWALGVGPFARRVGP